MPPSKEATYRKGDFRRQQKQALRTCRSTLNQRVASLGGERKQNMKRRLIAVVLALLLVLVCVPSAFAMSNQSQGGNFECNGAITGVVDANVVVEPGIFCIALGATIEGHVMVEPGAIGFHAHGSTIRDYVKADNPQLDIRVLNSTVGTYVEISDTHPGTFGEICRSDIGGNIYLHNNAGQMVIGSGGLNVCFAANTIHGSVKLYSNSGQFFVNDNQISLNVNVLSNTGFEAILANQLGG